MFLGGWTGYAFVAAAVAIGSMWLMHELDAAKYARLEAAVATAHAATLVRIAQERDTFAKLLRTAEQAAADEKARREAEAKQFAVELSEALNQASKNDANLDRCLRYRLPPSVLQKLSQ